MATVILQKIHDPLSRYHDRVVLFVDGGNTWVVGNDGNPEKIREVWPTAYLRFVEFSDVPVSREEKVVEKIVEKVVEKERVVEKIVEVERKLSEVHQTALLLGLQTLQVARSNERLRSAKTDSANAVDLFNRRMKELLRAGRVSSEHISGLCTDEEE